MLGLNLGRSFPGATISLVKSALSIVSVNCHYDKVLLTNSSSRYIARVRIATKYRDGENAHVEK